MHKEKWDGADKTHCPNRRHMTIPLGYVARQKIAMTGPPNVRDGSPNHIFDKLTFHSSRNFFINTLVTTCLFYLICDEHVGGGNVGDGNVGDDDDESDVMI